MSTIPPGCHGLPPVAGATTTSTTSAPAPVVPANGGAAAQPFDINVLAGGSTKAGGASGAGGAGTSAGTAGLSGLSVVAGGGGPGTGSATGGGAGTASATGGGPGSMRNLGTKVRGTKRPIVVGIGGASFSFPSIEKSNKSVNAPAVSWGANWKPEGNHMVHTNGTKAYPGTQNRISIPTGMGNPVTTPNGKGHKLPDGSVVGMDKAGKPFLMHADGKVEPLDKGTHNIGGVGIRVFEARTVNVVTPDGRFMRYDSRGNVRLGRGAAARALDAGTAVGGGPTMPKTREEFLQQQLAIVKALLVKVQNNTATEAEIAQAQMLLQGLPPSLTQILGGVGALGGKADANGGGKSGTTAGGSSSSGSTTQTPGASGSSTTNGGPGAPPVGSGTTAAPNGTPVNFAAMTPDELGAMRARLVSESAVSGDPAVRSANTMTIQMIDATLAAR